LLIVNTFLWCAPLYVFGIAKLIVPIERWRQAMNVVLRQLAEGWIQCNSLLLDLVHEIEWDVRGDGAPRAPQWAHACTGACAVKPSRSISDILG